MATVKLLLRQKKNKDGSFPATAPLVIRITKDRKTSFMYLGHTIKVTDWDDVNQRVKKSHPNSTRLNNKILKSLAEANDMALELETQKSAVSSGSIKRKIKPLGGSSFASQAELYLENLKSTGKFNRHNTDKSRIKHFKAFLTGGDISFADITIPLLERFKVYLKSEYGNGERTIVNHLVVIRSVFSQAIKSEIVDRKYYPFGAGKIQIKFPDSMKIGLSPEEVTKLENVDFPKGSPQNYARNLWLFSFYFAGMRVSDVLRLKWSDFQNDRLYYAMGKNAKGGSLKVADKALAIVAQYEEDKKGNEDLIFPDLKGIEDLTDNFLVQRKIAIATYRIDRYLKEHVAPKAEITKKLTMHIARHTFGNISGDRIPIQMLQKLYRHTSISTTIGYQANFIHKDADEALDAVIGF